jgi:hypothetical protein
MNFKTRAEIRSQTSCSKSTVADALLAVTCSSGNRTRAMGGSRTRLREHCAVCSCSCSWRGEYRARASGRTSRAWNSWKIDSRRKKSLRARLLPMRGIENQRLNRALGALERVAGTDTHWPGTRAGKRYQAGAKNLRATATVKAAPGCVAQKLRTEIS